VTVRLVTLFRVRGRSVFRLLHRSRCAAALFFLSLGLTSVGEIGCRAHRPFSVPEGAVYVGLSPNGGWAYCWFDSAIRLDRCRTYSADGRRLYRFGHENSDDDVFLKADGSGAVPQDQLKIDVVHTSDGFVWLENDIVLVPRDDFDNQRQLVEDIINSGRRAQNVGGEQPANEDHLAAALVSGDESQVRSLTDEVVGGKRTLDSRLLKDDRAVARNIILWATVDDREWQIGVEHVSDYALCVLELKNRTSSDKILSAVAPTLRSQCTTATTPNTRGCEVCDSHAFPVSSDVKSALVGYWRSKLSPLK